ncbi:MAG TPA: septum site-determining protein MinC [Polyangia bacterium]|jgi:septum site-determining protein MinC|nr:septum site-determining protein MinC [Polyangia bacterium]
MLDTMFATQTMAELSVRQGRVADAVAIYRHLLSGAEADPRIEKWKCRLTELEAGATGAATPAAPRAASLSRTAPAPAEVAEPAGQRASLVIREPVRSGQVIYAEGRDLIVVAPVHSGAQLLADGNIHVYGPLKGRAVAGARGLREAQLFCLALEAELVGVDTGYLLSDDIPAALSGGPARVFLTAEGTCAVAALPAGKGGAPATANRARAPGDMKRPPF